MTPSKCLKIKFINPYKVLRITPDLQSVFYKCFLLLLSLLLYGGTSGGRENGGNKMASSLPVLPLS